MGNDGGRVGSSSSRGGRVQKAGGGLEVVKGKLNIGPRSRTSGPQGRERAFLANSLEEALSGVAGKVPFKMKNGKKIPLSHRGRGEYGIRTSHNRDPRQSRDPMKSLKSTVTNSTGFGSRSSATKYFNKIRRSINTSTRRCGVIRVVKGSDGKYYARMSVVSRHRTMPKGLAKATSRRVATARAKKAAARAKKTEQKKKKSSARKTPRQRQTRR